MAVAPAVAPVLDLLRERLAAHSRRTWHWGIDTDPFEVCVGAILVQNTAWANVERAIAALRTANVLTPAAMATLDMPALEALIRPSGQYRQKAKKLRAFLATAQAAGGFEHLLHLPVAELRERLLATWGIGPETADCILLYAARQPAIVVDAYTVRLLRRLGHGPAEGAGYDAWAAWLGQRLPADVATLAAFHAWVVLHCKHVCTKLRPACGGCGLRDACAFAAHQSQT